MSNKTAANLPVLFPKALAPEIQSQMDRAPVPMVPTGPPVPDNLAREILSEVSEFLHHLRIQSPRYQVALTQLHPQAKAIGDFLRSKNPLQVGSFNQLRRLASRLRLSIRSSGRRRRIAWSRIHSRRLPSAEST